MLKITMLLFLAAATAWSTSTPTVAGQSAVGGADLAQDPVMDLVIQKVCIDPAGKVLPVDPFDCHGADRLRPLRVGESLPYHKHDQPQPGHPDGIQRKDSYPVLDAEGQLLIVNPFDHEPFDRYKASGDGYDLIRVRDGWVSISGTRDGGGFSTTFFGAGCRPWGGWVSFPATDPVVAGSADLPISGRHWQQNGESWPGKCDPSRVNGSLTSWDWLPGFHFSGVDGSPAKILDALRSIHGSPERPSFLQKGHLEVFYFTRLYGLTRWETWRPTQQVEQSDESRRKAAHARVVCGEPYEMTYRGVALVMSACRDWSAVTLARAPEPPPAWPIPDMNLLRNFSFAEGLSQWTVSGKPGALRIENSGLARDTKYLQQGGNGVRYVAIDCAENCPALSQDILAPSASTGANLVFAATIRSERGAGSVRLSLTQRDQAGNNLNTSAVTAQVSPGNERFAGSETVLLSSTFVICPRPVPLDLRAKTLIFTITPVSSGSFDIVDAWVMPSPAP